MAPKRDISNAGLYDRLDALRLEFKADLGAAVTSVAVSQGRLEKKFDDLEQGRLTRLEGKMTDFEIAQNRRDNVISQNQATMSTKLVIIWGASAILITAFVTALAYKLVGVIK